MGVSGSGKSTIGNLLAEQVNIPFFDGDDFHPETNIAKMSSGQPLNDEDRWPWLQAINRLAIEESNKKGCVIACSALKQSYRELLDQSLNGISKWVYLKGTFEQIEKRINERGGHFMGSKLLASQFATLEIPENAIDIDISDEPQIIVETIKRKIKMSSEKAEIGLFGLGVMGKSLGRNLASRGFVVSLFNRHMAGKEENVAKDFTEEFEELSEALPFDDVAAFVGSLRMPRKIMLMVNAGKTVDLVIEDILPHLDAGDILIDGGNSNFNKTKERYDYLKSKGINFVGTGVSGGEEGALKGPSIMPGCDKDVYQHVKPYLESIAAKDANGLPCCTHIGNEGSGHFVKMIHNGIEYAEMQMLAEVYSIFRAQGSSPDEMADVLEGWKKTANSYLLEITVDILRKKEGEDWLINKIMDKAGNKGTGNWTAITTAQLGVPSTMIAAALFARYSSFFKDERVAASQNFKSHLNVKLDVDNNEILEAYQFARLMNHYQGFKLILEASKRFEWNLNLTELSRIWTNGCIIRSALMVELVEIFKSTDNMLSHPDVIERLKTWRPSAKKVVSQCILNEIAIPCLSEAINYLNGFVLADSSANIIQAQRDYFGAHTYQRKDDDSNKFYHTEWKNS